MLHYYLKGFVWLSDQWLHSVSRTWLLFRDYAPFGLSFRKWTEPSEKGNNASNSHEARPEEVGYWVWTQPEIHVFPIVSVTQQQSYSVNVFSFFSLQGNFFRSQKGGTQQG